VGLYLQALRAADTAYDRTLLATAKTLGEQLEVATGPNGRPRLSGNLLYSALEAFEADNRSRLYYRVSGFDGEMVSGFDDLPRWLGPLPDNRTYAALVHFYDGQVRGDKVRLAVLLQPVAGVAGQGMATIQVAETLELRQALARRLLLDTLWWQVAMIGVIAAVVVWVVQRATAPVRQLSARLAQRHEADLAPLPAQDAPGEITPLVDATNQLMRRLGQLHELQRRFVRDTSHQLRTPLAVLKAQVQSAQRGDVDATTALAEIGHTVDGATRLANQMLALAKVEQLRQQGLPPVLDWATPVREVALELGPLAAQRSLDFSLATCAAPVRAHDWALRELVRNLLHNAIKHAPPGTPLAVAMHADGRHAALTLTDAGPGLPPGYRERLFQPFAAGDARSGSGLGLAICGEIVRSLGGQLALEPAEPGPGLVATVRLPLAENPAP
jgi:two-component system sensor histidine kinase TctE